jgi:hypothetical protein
MAYSLSELPVRQLPDQMGYDGSTLSNALIVALELQVLLLGHHRTDDRRFPHLPIIPALYV